MGEGLGLRVGVQTLMGGGGGGLYKYEGRTPINANTGGGAEVMQTITLETGVVGRWLSGMALRADVEII